MSEASLINGCYEPDENKVCKNPNKNWGECSNLDNCPYYNTKEEILVETTRQELFKNRPRYSEREIKIPYVNRYRCDCGKTNSRLFNGTICNECNTEVTKKEI